MRAPHDPPDAEGDDALGPGDSASASDPSKGKAQRAVQSIEVGGRLLLALADAQGPLSLKDLAARAGLPASRAHPYLVSFGKLGLVEQDAPSGRYALGFAALQLGLTYLNQLDAVRAATPVVEALAADTGHAAALAVWGNFGPTIIRMIEARQPLHVSMRAGTVMSIFETATGRAFAAALPQARIEGAIARALGDPSGAGTGLAPAQYAQAWRDAVDELREHGVTRAVSNPIPGINAFSAAAFDHAGDAAIVLTLLGHQEALPADWDGPAVVALKRAATQVSTRLGWRGPPPLQPPLRRD